MHSSGEVKITDDVISSIAGAAAMKIEGVHSLSGSVVEGIGEMFGKKSFSKGIVVELGEEGYRIDANIIVEHGYKIQDVALKAQRSIENDVKNMIGLDIEAVNIYVDGVKIDESKESSDSED